MPTPLQATWGKIYYTKKGAGGLLKAGIPCRIIRGGEWPSIVIQTLTGDIYHVKHDEIE